MRVVGQDLRELVAEQRLVREVVALVRRCDGRPPAEVLDAVLAGRAAARPAVPQQRGRRSS